MSTVASPRFLRYVLYADAASCVATGALQLLFTPSLAHLLNLPADIAHGHRLVPAGLCGHRCASSRRANHCRGR